jgi:hypothetical protein
MEWLIDSLLLLAVLALAPLNWALISAKSSRFGMMLYCGFAFNLLVTNPKDVY